MPHYFDLRIVSVKGAPDTEIVGRNDLYVRVEVFELNSATPSAKMDTPVLDGCGTSGTWNHLFKGLSFSGDPDQARVKLTLMNKNLISDDQLGLYNSDDVSPSTFTDPSTTESAPVHSVRSQQMARLLRT